MEKKNLAYWGLGVALLLFVGTFAMVGTGMMGRIGGKSVSSTEDMGDMMNSQVGEAQFLSASNEDLSKYRSEDIPSDCRLADSDNDVKKWAEHLSHHENTRYCLEYYENIGG